MKERIITAAIAALLAGASMFFAGKGCTPDAPPPREVPVFVDREVPVAMPADSAQFAARIVYKTAKPAPTDSLALAAYRTEVARLREQLMDARMQLSEYEYQTAVADTAYDRTMVIMQGNERTVVPWRDSTQLAYDYPPLNRFTITQQGRTVITLPEPAATDSSAEGRAWWVDVLIAVLGAAATLTGTVLAK